MITFTIKYEDTNGVVHIEQYKTWDKDSAVSLLKHPVKEIYIIEAATVLQDQESIEKEYEEYLNEMEKREQELNREYSLDFFNRKR